MPNSARGNKVLQFLVKWHGQLAENTTWIYEADFFGQFLNFGLEIRPSLPKIDVRQPKEFPEIKRFQVYSRTFKREAYKLLGDEKAFRNEWPVG